MKTAIRCEDIRKGDLIRREYDVDSAQEYRAVSNGLKPLFDNDNRYFLLDRPRKLKYAKGTELWLTTRYFPWSKDDRIILREDWYEDDFEGKVVYPGKNYIISEYAVTDVRPRVLKWAKGTRLWFKDSAENRVAMHSGEYTVGGDVYEDTRYVDGAYFPHRFTTEKPEPHPVGAIRWVTEDCKSPYDYQFKKGDPVKVKDFDDDGHAGHIVVVPQTGDSQKPKYLNTKYLSETLVEPAPTIVAVPLPAIEKLRDESWDARLVGGPGDRAFARKIAIDDFLNTREVKTALREDDKW